MTTILQVGQILEDVEGDRRYCITRFEPDPFRSNLVRAYANFMYYDDVVREVYFCAVSSDHVVDRHFLDFWRLAKPIKKHKEIPGIPLDPELHPLQAGYIQDRQRKRYKQPKQSP